MRTIVLFAILACALAAPKPYKAERCTAEKCKLPKCRCSNQRIPGELNAADIPQFVFLTFDDAVTRDNYENFYKKAFFNRKNPDGCPIQTTYFVSHEYTDYSFVQHLHAKGHEIALHSITHKSYTDYWRTLSKEGHIKEFGGQRDLLSHFAKIPKADLKGSRLPLLQQSGDNYTQAIKQIGLEYDCSWPTRNNYWPYTLDYASLQDCSSPPCPQESAPGLWIVPMLMLKNAQNAECSMVDACDVENKKDRIYEFLKTNFDKQYFGKKTPVGYYMHAAWFGQRSEAFDAYNQFLDYIQRFKDVYIVGVSRGLEWVRNPTKLSDLKKLWPNCPKTYQPTCDTNVETSPLCKLTKYEEDGTQSERYMKSCTECPDIYPWLDNPLGVAP